MTNILHQLEREEDDANLAYLRSEVERLRLTDAEREAVERGYCSLMGVEDMSAECSRWDAEAAATLRALLERLGTIGHQ